jgi:PAS domain S-box-containing protein
MKTKNHLNDDDIIPSILSHLKDEVLTNSIITFSSNKSNEEYFEQLANNYQITNVAMFCSSLDGTINTWNKASEKMLGFTSIEILGKNISVIIPTKFIVGEKDIFDKICENKTVVNHESARNSKSGKSLAVSISLSPLKNNTGSIVGVCTILRDNSIQKKLEKTLNTANKVINFQNTERDKRAGELLLANLELAYQNKEKQNRVDELFVANNELAHQNKEKENRAAELLVANEELIYQNKEKQNRADELLIANNELAYQNSEKANRAAELLVANEELAFQNQEKKNRANELLIANKELAHQNNEKENRAAELLIANEELVYQNNEKHKRAEELIVANEELKYQNKEKENRAAELLIANVELVHQNKEKQKRAEELKFAVDELAFLNMQQQALFASIVNSSDDAMLSKTLDGVITSWNLAAEKIFGYTAEEMIGKNVKTLIPQHHHFEEENIIERIKKGETINNYSTERVSKDGTIIYGSVTITPIKDFKGNIIGASKILKDIKEIKKAEKERKLLTKRLQLATKSANLGIWDWDITNNTIAADTAMYKFYDIKEQTVTIPEEWLSKVHYEDQQQVREELELAIKNKKDYDTEFRVVGDNSTIHFIRATAIVERNDDGRAIGMIGASWDITVEKEKERHLKLLESVITHTKDAIVITEAESFDEPGNKIIFVNNAFTEMTGYTFNEVIGKTTSLLQGPNSDKQELQRLGVAIKKWESFETSIINYKKNGDEFWVNLSLTPVANEKGIWSHWIAIERDVTAQTLLEFQLKDLNRELEDSTTNLALSNEELERFAYIASHDLQEPLRMVSNFLTTLEREYSDVIDERGKKYIWFAVDGAKRMRQIILDLLEYSKIGRSNVAPRLIDLNELFIEIKVLLAEKIKDKKASITIDNLPFINADISPIRQVLQNLIYNALEYSSHVKPVKIRVSVKELEAFWEFAVADNGIGIKIEDFEKIFQMFQRLHSTEEHPGTGIGLAVSKKIIETQGGKIWLESEEGKGSTFYFTIKK